jgi:prepilin-type N-terminal cleavage/methylation domain-containing protein
MSIRSGFTLTELMVTMSVGSVLMVLAVGLVHQSMQLTATTRRVADEHQAISRLASQFRDDVRRADQVRIESDKVVRISIPERGEITYSAEAATCTRTMMDPAVEPRTNWAGSEEYRLLPGGQIRFESLEQPRRAALVLSRGNATLHQRQQDGPASGAHEPSPRESLRVEARSEQWRELFARRP